MESLKTICSRILLVVLLTTCFNFSRGNLYARDYKHKITQDSIRISYTWRKDRKLKRDSSYILNLQLENLSSDKVTVSFFVLFYWKAQLHSGSKIKKYCLKPGKKIKGKKWGLAFNSTVFTLNEYLDPMFSWYIDDLKVKNSDSCNPRLRLRLEPAYP